MADAGRLDPKNNTSSASPTRAARWRGRSRRSSALGRRPGDRAEGREGPRRGQVGPADRAGLRHDGAVRRRPRRGARPAGRAGDGQEATFAGGAAATIKVLKDHGFDTTGVKLSDGSGISTENKIPAKLLTQLMAAAAAPEGKNPNTASCARCWPASRWRVAPARSPTSGSRRRRHRPAAAGCGRRGHADRRQRARRPGPGPGRAGAGVRVHVERLGPATGPGRDRRPRDEPAQVRVLVAGGLGPADPRGGRGAAADLPCQRHEAVRVGADPRVSSRRARVTSLCKCVLVRGRRTVRRSWPETHTGQVASEG